MFLPILSMSELPVYLQIRQNFAADASAANGQRLRFAKGEIVYRLSCLKRGQFLIKKLDQTSSVVGWVPEDYLTKPKAGPFRVTHDLGIGKSRVCKGEILQVTGASIAFSSAIA